jgi:hypothetical protein
MIGRKVDPRELVFSPRPATRTSDAKLPQQQKHRSVTFGRDVHCTFIQHLDDYSYEDIRAIWYSDGDYKKFRQENNTTVAMMVKGQTLHENDKQYCYRGLVSAVLKVRGFASMILFFQSSPDPLIQILGR